MNARAEAGVVNRAWDMRIDRSFRQPDGGGGQRPVVVEDAAVVAARR